MRWRRHCFFDHLTSRCNQERARARRREELSAVSINLRRARVRLSSGASTRSNTERTRGRVTKRTKQHPAARAARIIRYRPTEISSVESFARACVCLCSCESAGSRPKRTRGETSQQAIPSETRKKRSQHVVGSQSSLDNPYRRIRCLPPPPTSGKPAAGRPADGGARRARRRHSRRFPLRSARFRLQEFEAGSRRRTVEPAVALRAAPGQAPG